MFQLCLSRYVLITLCILVLSFEFDFVWSSRYFPVYPVSESCLDVSIKYYYLSLCPRLRVPVPPSCVHRDIYDHFRLIQHGFVFSVLWSYLFPNMPLKMHLVRWSKIESESFMWNSLIIFIIYIYIKKDLILALEIQFLRPRVIKKWERKWH